MKTGEFVWSLVVLVACVGFGGFYLAKQLGWFGGLAVERLAAPIRPWSRWRRRLAAVLCMATGVVLFVWVNWVDVRTNPVLWTRFAVVLLALCVVLFVLGVLEFREIRRLGRRLRAGSRRVSRDDRNRVMSQLRRPGGGNGDSPGEQAEER